MKFLLSPVSLFSPCYWSLNNAAIVSDLTWLQLWSSCVCSPGPVSAFLGSPDTAPWSPYSTRLKAVSLPFSALAIPPGAPTPQLPFPVVPVDSQPAAKSSPDDPCRFWSGRGKERLGCGRITFWNRCLYIRSFCAPPWSWKAVTS